MSANKREGMHPIRCIQQGSVEVDLEIGQPQFVQEHRL